MLRPLAVAPILLAAAAFAAPPAEQSTPQPSPPSKPAAETPLSGPKVAEPAKAADTLVRRGVDGKIERLDEPAELAVLRLLKLDDESRKKLDAIVYRRVRIIDDFVADNLPMLTEFQTAAATKDKAGLFRLLGEAGRKLDSLWTDGTLEQQVRRELSMTEQSRFDRLIADYWNAVVDERRADPTDVDDNGKQKNRLGIMIDERLKVFGKELERSFARVVESGELIYRYLFKDMTLHDDQPAQLRTLCAEFSRTTKLAPTKEQGEKFFRELSRVLDAEQRKEAIARFLKIVKGKK